MIRVLTFQLINMKDPSFSLVWWIAPKLSKPCVSLMTRSPMVTHDSRKNEHCAVEEYTPKATSNFFQKSLKTNYYNCFCSKHLFAREWTEGRGYLLHLDTYRLRVSLLTACVVLELATWESGKGSKSRTFFIPLFSSDNVCFKWKKNITVTFHT